MKVCNFATNIFGNLYRKTKNQEVEVLDNRIKVSNGLTWDEYTDTFFYVDSCTLTIKKYNWNRNGRISERTKS